MIKEVSSLVAQTVKRLPTMWETWVQSLHREDRLEKEMVPTPVFLPGKCHGWGSLVGYSPWGRKESDMTERLHFHFQRSGGSDSKESACNSGDPASISGSGRSLGEGNGNRLQYSCLENPMDGGAGWVTVHGVAKSQTQLSDLHLTSKKSR